ncbi:malto-oligosyltrehalose synthase [Streptomyces iconiensis]|uniref:Malto-oligosyltrehalose synthase n=1 Tax=Streptomyces iconiensis TaxID=1384038 RepID=A0ABT7AAW7_9ACTN|nr:malto-oligosyltrehalose synthase [Streptomyces iconiensis]MDJ1137758.1 malto-oligosyltrehalose synthase [Streptomyces iconiensis]
MTREGAPPATPTSTYRLQLQPDFPFAAAERAVPYLARLGVSHLHLSPVLTAVPGSRHGYDVTDHRTVREELGGERGLRALSATARAHGLGLVLDIVPNHMAVPADLRLNGPLWETLREGPGSPWAHWFDIDWEAGGGRVLLPFLGERLHEALPRMRVQDGALRYGQRVLPLRAGTAHLPLPLLCEAQHYRLCWWRLGRTELNYRRFFTISDLIAVRVEDPGVFAATHHTVLRLLREGVADGLRVDHPDGLADPGGYLLRLHEATRGRWTVVEKILADGEALPASWPVAGTTGYDALRHIDGVLTDPEGAAELASAYREFTRVRADQGGAWTATRRRAAYRVVVHELAAEAERLTRTAVRACAAAPDPRLRDHAPWALRAALREMLVRLPVYRPYTSCGAPPGESDAALLEHDAALLEHAAEGARTAFRVPEEAAAVDAVRDLALGAVPDGGPAAAGFPARFAQLASALRAKSVEDAAFYRYVPLLSACEVGGEPGSPALAPGDFHAYCARVQRDWPTTSTALSTHDTKRSGDARAALAVLSECPGRWEALLRETGSGEAAAPDAHTAWVHWQTALALGTYPPPPERLLPALLKAVREAGLRTTWTERDLAYETAVERFVNESASGPGARALAALAASLEPHVRANVLGAALLHLTMPGVPDLYQGTERTYRALVDPDNRAPLDLGGLAGPFAGRGDGSVAGRDAGPFAGRGDGSVAGRDDGSVVGRGAGGASSRLGSALDAEKVRLTATVLRLRARNPGLFLDAAWYEPLGAEGEAADHCVAFVRSGTVLTVVTRLSLRLAERGGWARTELPLPEGDWHEALPPDAAIPRVLSGRVPLARLLGTSPVALLVRGDLT